MMASNEEETLKTTEAPSPPSEGERILILSVLPRDAQLVKEVLERTGFATRIVSTIGDLCHEIGRGVGVAIVAKEALKGAGLARCLAVLRLQPPWSEIPLLILASHDDLSAANLQSLRLLELIKGATLIERPVKIPTLISHVRAALANRRRQYGIRELLASLEEARDAADSANRAKSDFLANMSHEIRTPLGAVLGFSELLMDSTASPQDRARYAEIIRHSSQLLSTLIDDILDLAKVEAAKLQIELTEVPLLDLVRELILLLNFKAEAKGIRLHLATEGAVPEKIRTDPTRLRQILINVIGNAVKFTEQGEVRMTVRDVPSRPGKERQLVFEVADTGIGLTVEQQSRLFQSFSQADSSMTRRFGGSGLGLLLSSRLAQALGGEVTLKQSQPGHGSTFLVSLPARGAEGVASLQAPPPTKTVASAGKSASWSPDLHDLNILVVDDSADLRFLLGRLLAPSKAQVGFASNGVEAIEKVEHGNFDIVLMDVQMPVLDGYQATSALRKSGHRLPIVALTAHAFQEDRARSLEAGCDDHISKPIDRSALFESIARLTAHQ